ncbi:MAG: NUDIX domain-containing protein [Terriglobia bacterium]
MSRRSAGLIMYRTRAGRLEVLLAHPGGPLWAKKDHGAWSIPKGEIADGEDALDTAKREFEEETGIAASGPFTSLGTIKQKGGKTVEAWAVEGDFDPSSIESNSFAMEWPPRSGNIRQFPEIDRAEFFDLDEAQRRINAAQAELLGKLLEVISFD